jgi:hypothetical protein
MSELYGTMNIGAGSFNVKLDGLDFYTRCYVEGNEHTVIIHGDGTIEIVFENEKLFLKGPDLDYIRRHVPTQKLK